MTAPAPDLPAATQRLTVAALLLVTFAAVVLVAVLNPGLVRFWPMSAGEFVQAVAPLLLVSLFIERVLEVFVTTWRGPDAARLALDARVAKTAVVAAGAPAPAAERALVDYKAATQRIALPAGIALGVVISALGVRALGMFVDPAVFRTLPPLQQQWFGAADALLTGAVLGGGSDGLHKLVSVFTTFLDASAASARKRKDEVS